MVPRRLRWHRVARLGITLPVVLWSVTGCNSTWSVNLARSTRKTDSTGQTASTENSAPKSSAIVSLSYEIAAPAIADSTRFQDQASLAQTLPIDLPTALRLGGANNLEINLARERINAALARLDGAEVLWLPSLSAGNSYVHHDGQLQRATGEVLDVHRSSLFVGGGPTLAVDVADAIYEPLVAAQVLRAEQAAATVTTNDTLLRIAEAYLDLLAAHANLAIAEETRDNAAKLAKGTEEFANQGAGLQSDAARTQTELGTREQQVVAAKERLVVASAELSRLLRLDPQIQLAPLEPTALPIDLVPDGQPLSDLVAHSLSQRPELREQQAIVDATVERLRQARYGPLIPSVLLGYSAGGFGGGPNGFFGNFDSREDFTAAAVWELRNLGLGDRSQRRLRESQLTQAQLLSLQIADRIAAEVVAAAQVVSSRREQVDITKRTIESAVRSLELNVARIRGGAGLPIEALQAIQALDRERIDHLQAVTSYNKAQFRLLTALGNAPVAPADSRNGPERAPAPKSIPPDRGTKY